MCFHFFFFLFLLFKLLNSSKFNIHRQENGEKKENLRNGKKSYYHLWGFKKRYFILLVYNLVNSVLCILFIFSFFLFTPFHLRQPLDFLAPHSAHNPLGRRLCVCVSCTICTVQGTQIEERKSFPTVSFSSSELCYPVDARKLYSNAVLCA